MLPAHFFGRKPLLRGRSVTQFVRRWLVMAERAGPGRRRSEAGGYRARRWQQALRSGQFRTLREIAAEEGITVARVSQLLTLNRISPQALHQIQQKTAAQRCPVKVGRRLQSCLGAGGWAAPGTCFTSAAAAGTGPRYFFRTRYFNSVSPTLRMPCSCHDGQ